MSATRSSSVAMSGAKTPQVWRLICFYLRNEPSLLPIAEMFTVGVNDSERIASALEIPVAEVEERKAAFHQRLAELRRSLESGRRLASRLGRGTQEPAAA